MPLKANVPAESSRQKVTRRLDGSVVLMCESANPRLGVLFTPTDDGQLIVTMPGDDGHPLSAVSILLGSAQIHALAELVRRKRRLIDGSQDPPAVLGADPSP